MLMTTQEEPHSSPLDSDTKHLDLGVKAFPWIPPLLWGYLLSVFISVVNPCNCQVIHKIP